MSERMLPDRVISGYWKLLKGYRTIFVFSFIVLAGAIALQIGGTLLLKEIVDNIKSMDLRVPIAAMAFIYIGLALGRGFFLFLNGRTVAKISEGVTRDLRDALFDHMQKLTFSYHDQMRTGELIQRSTSDVDSIRKFFGEEVPGIARIVIMFIFNFAAIMFLQWKLALLSSIIAPVIIITSAYFFGRIHNAFMQYQDQDGVVSSVLQENLSGVRIVRAFARKDFENEKFETENLKKFNLGKIFLIRHTVYWPVSHILCATQMILGFAVGGIMTINGEISLGTYIAYLQMASALIWPLQQLGRMIAQLSTAFVSYERVSEILNEDDEDLDKGARDIKIQGSVSVRNLEFGYLKNTKILKGVSFEVKKGEKIALLGEAGSGKTTMINLLPRFYDFSKGEILLDGKPLQKYSRHFLRENIGIVEQEPFLFSATIRENIAYGAHRKVTQEEIENAAKAASIHNSIMSFPKGYDTIVGEKGVTLSGGQKQRTAIARTLLKDPRILILDDSTSAVDAETEDSIRECLTELMKGRTSFIIAHRIQSLTDADRILVFKDGKIIQEGAHDTLKDKPGFYKKVFELQTRIEEELDKEINYA